MSQTCSSSWIFVLFTELVPFSELVPIAWDSTCICFAFCSESSQLLAPVMTHNMMTRAWSAYIDHGHYLIKTMIIHRSWSWSYFIRRLSFPWPTSAAESSATKIAINFSKQNEVQFLFLEYSKLLSPAGLFSGSEVTANAGTEEWSRKSEMNSHGK